MRFAQLDREHAGRAIRQLISPKPEAKRCEIQCWHLRFRCHYSSYSQASLRKGKHLRWQRSADQKLHKHYMSFCPLHVTGCGPLLNTAKVNHVHIPRVHPFCVMNHQPIFSHRPQAAARPRRNMPDRTGSMSDLQGLRECIRGSWKLHGVRQDLLRLTEACKA